jgi:DNA-binding NtrC family response regulator
MAKILVVDDDKNIRQTLARFLESCGHQAVIAEGSREALELISEGSEYDLVLTDFRMAEMDGLDLLKAIKAKVPESVVVLMTAYGTIDKAVAAVKAGAYDYMSKPFSLDQVQHLVKRILELRQLRSQNRALRDAIDGLPVLESNNSALRALISTAFQAASSDAIILLTGESGTGKNVLAHQIHEWSPRRQRPFVTVSCTTLSENLIESERC